MGIRRSLNREMKKLGFLPDLIEQRAAERPQDEEWARFNESPLTQ